MKKIEIVDPSDGVRNILYPYLPVLVGVTVDGRPNYITIGLVGWLCYDAMSVSVGRKQYSNPGIRQNGCFSINQPTAGMVKELDYCGIHSGRKVDKSSLFTNFYGELKSAPMIEECPVNIECRVIHTLERRIHTVFIGEVVSAYLDEEYMSAGIPDLEKISPVFYAPKVAGGKHTGIYWGLGDDLGQAWKVGADLNKPGRE